MQRNLRSIISAALLAAPFVNGHYIFSQLIVNDSPVGSDYSYIRKNTNSYMPSFTADVVDSPDLICNQGAQTAYSETYDVVAGDKIGFKLSFGEFIEHPGPAFVYMSKAPDTVDTYDGTGDWFKAFESGVTGDAATDTNWASWQKDRIEFTIPADIPDGEYLVRPEHIAIHEGHVGKAQFYMECAQLRITGGGSGTPSPLVQIPGLYSAQDPGIAFDKWSGNTGTYEMPGPAVWGGGGASTSAASTTGGSASTGSTSGTTGGDAAAAVGGSASGATSGSTSGSASTGATSGSSSTGADAATGGSASTGASTGAAAGGSSSTTGGADSGYASTGGSAAAAPASGSSGSTSGTTGSAAGGAAAGWGGSANTGGWSSRGHAREFEASC